MNNYPYDDPDKLDYSNLEEPIREICKLINSSDWLRTLESCAGHPRSRDAWSEATYFRLCLFKPKFEDFFFWIQSLDEAFNEHINVQFDQIFDFGHSFYVTFPKQPTPSLRDVLITIAIDKFKEIEGKYND